MDQPGGKTIFSGIQPSGLLHVGNYIGALKQWVALQGTNTAYYCVVDEHAITVPYDPAQLPDRILDTVAMYLACGLDPDQNTIFVQSHVPAHTELAWLLATLTPFGELSRMTQFKDKAQKNRAAASAGLFTYPILMAADILLYHADAVPVGEDQHQHLEFTREVARRFNARFGDIFTIPAAYINPQTARIMSLTNPTQKMSKSDAANSYLALTDRPDSIRQKIKGAVTETEPVFSFTTSGPAVRNLLNLYAAFSDEAKEAIEQRFNKQGYKEFKDNLAELLIEKLTPIQTAYAALRSDTQPLHAILESGREQAVAVANQSLAKVKAAMGLQIKPLPQEQG